MDPDPESSGHPTPLAVPKALPVITAITVSGKRREVAWAGETVQLKDSTARRAS
jgi:hypothetical protein